MDINTILSNIDILQKRKKMIDELIRLIEESDYIIIAIPA